MDSYTSSIKYIPERKRKTALFKQAPDRLSQLQRLLKTEIKTTAIQRVPMVTSFMVTKSPSISTRSSTPVASDDEVCFNVAQKKEQHGVTFDKQLGQDDYLVSQPLQGSPPVLYGTPQMSQGIPPFNKSPVQVPPFMSQPPVQGLPPYTQPSQPKQDIPPTSPPASQSLPSLRQEFPPASHSLQGLLTSQPFPPMSQSLQGLLTSKISQGYPPASQEVSLISQPLFGLPPMSHPSLGSSPFTLLSSFTTHLENSPFPTITSVGFGGQSFSLQSTAPPPPPQIHHGTSTTTTTTKTPAEMAAEAALKRQDSVVVTTTLQNTMTMNEASRAPVVVITASEMPPSSLFFTAKSQGGKAATEGSSSGTSEVSRFAAPERSNSLPSNVKFPFSAQTTTGMKLPFSTSGTQTPLAFSLTANKMSATSTPVSNPEANVASVASVSKAASNLVTTSAAKLVPSLQTTMTTESANSAESSNVKITKPFAETEETTEESGQSDNEHDATLTDTTNAHMVTTLSLPTFVSATATTVIATVSNATSDVSVSAPAAVASVVTAAEGAPPPASSIVAPASSIVATPPVSAAAVTLTTTAPSLITPTVAATLTTVTLSTAAATVQSSAPPTVTFATEASTASSLQTSNIKSVVPASTTAQSFSLTVASSSETDGTPHSVTLLKVPPNDKLTDSDEEADLCDNAIDKVSSQSSIMTDDINVVDDASEGEMEPNGLCACVCAC